VPQPKEKANGHYVHQAHGLTLALLVGSDMCSLGVGFQS